jgi:hypothetical protein
MILLGCRALSVAGKKDSNSDSDLDIDIDVDVVVLLLLNQKIEDVKKGVLNVRIQENGSLTVIKNDMQT